MGPNKVYNAMADPTRRRILDLLSSTDLAASQIAGHFKISKPSISHHLSVLKEAGLVLDQRQGQNIIYSLNTTVFQDVLSWIMNLMNKEEKRDE